MLGQTRIGPHLVIVEGELVIIAEQSVWALDEMVQLLAILDRLFMQHGRIFLLDNMSNGLSVPPETRRYVIEWLKNHKIAAISAVGTGAVVRATVQLILRGAQLLGAKLPLIHFCDTLSEGRTWIDAQRQAWTVAHTPGRG